MGVQVKEWKGAWWIFVNHKGQRKAKRVGEGKAWHRAALTAAEKIQARLVLGDLSLEVEIFTPEELARLLQTAAEEMPEAYRLVLILARTGLRIGEALTLQVSDIDSGLRVVQDGHG